MSFLDLAIAIICPFLYILLLTSLFIYIFRKKLNFQTALPIALISTTLFVFLFTAIFHSITVGFWITVAASLVSIPLIVRDKNRSKVLRDSIFTPGFVAFVIIYTFLIAIDWFKVVPLLSDTSMHWAPHVWTMWVTDNFYTQPNLSIVNQGVYPPALQLFETIFSKAAGVYREGLLFLAIQLISLSMLFPVLKKLTWKPKANLKQFAITVALTAAILAVPLILFVSDFYSSLEVDAALGIIFAYSIYMAVSESRKFTVGGLLRFSLVITFLCLTKQIAILLAALAIFVYLANMFLNYRQSYSFKNIVNYFKKWTNHWARILVVLLISAIPFASIKIWSSQIVGYSSPDPSIAIFHISITDPLQIPGILAKESGSEAQQNFSRTFIKHMLTDPGGFLLNVLGSVSYMQISILFAGIMILIWYIYKTRRVKNSILLVTSVVFIGWFLYCFAIYCVFLFGGMKDIELNSIDTPNRYVRTYLLAMLVLVFMYLVPKFINDVNKPNGKKATLVVVIVFTILFGILFNKETVNAFGVQLINDRRDEIASLNIYQTKDNLTKLIGISGAEFGKPSKVLVTAKTDSERHYLQYQAVPNRITLLLFDNPVTQKSVCDKFYSNDYFVVGYSYLEESSWDSIDNCTDKDIELSQGSIYKIIKLDNNLVNLEKI